MTSKSERKLKARIRFLEKENQSFYERFAQLTTDIVELRARVRKLEAGQSLSSKPYLPGGDIVPTKGAPWVTFNDETTYTESMKDFAAEVDTHSVEFATCLHPDCVAQRERSAAEELKSLEPVEVPKHTGLIEQCQHPACIKLRENNKYGV